MNYLSLNLPFFPSTNMYSAPTMDMCYHPWPYEAYSILCGVRNKTNNYSKQILECQFVKYNKEDQGTYAKSREGRHLLGSDYWEADWKSEYKLVQQRG